MRLPLHNTIRYKVLDIIYRNGPGTVSELAAKLPPNSRRGAHGAISWGREMGFLNREGRVYSLTNEVREYLDEMHIDEVPFVPQVAGPTLRGNAWTPEMKGYEANLRRNWRAS